MNRVEEDKAARLAEMRKAGLAGKGNGRAEDGNSSHDCSEAQATEGAAGEELAGGNFAGLDALVMAAKELQKEGEVGKVVEPEEWLAAGAQAPEPDIEQHTRKRVAAGPAVRKVKNTTTKASKA